MIGIVGGVGPYAGTDLLNKIFNNTLASKDQEHLDAILLSMSSKIEDRTEYLLGKVKINPALAIVEVLHKLELIGSTIAGIPCNTAHSKKIFDTIQLELEKSKSRIKLLNMIDETVLFIASNYPDITKIGVLSTTGTYKSKLYASALRLKGYEAIVPPLEMQENTIHPAIYDKVYGIKTISNPIHPQARQNLLEGCSYLEEQGAELVILGCTEIPLAITESKINNMITVDPTNILARALIKYIDPLKLKPL
ncbi:MAG TPA: amino acid racemase [Gelidibacter sp.]|uniref:aspartate/glutamate racemase family protein n=1 Tax=Gelidibacter sp. TaxID=2018083 RepID=UPI002C9B7EE9|nr:amino acid racemase [Gelidibacter sp.]HXJ99603.1 amino acid racemase [Gelidibacter sp.]